MRKFNVELTEEQMWLVCSCLEDICRFAAGQTELRNTLPKLITDDAHFVEIKDKIETKLKSIKPILYPNLEFNEYLGYDDKPFIGNTYQIYRTMKHHLLKDKVEWVNVYTTPALPSGTMGEIKITEIKDV